MVNRQGRVLFANNNEKKEMKENSFFSGEGL